MAADEAGDAAGKGAIEGGAIETDLAGKMSYTDYLRLDDILGAQTPRSPEHDEPLFIIIHQVKELWLKLFNHELDAALGFVRTDRLPEAFKATARIGRIQEQLIGAWTVLSTMTPSEYLSFRPFLGPSSGFQSWQYRILEFKLGAKNAFMMEPHRHRPDLLAAVDAAYRAPGLYDEVLRLLARRGYAVPDAVLGRDVTAPYVPDPGVEAVWRAVYRDPQTHFEVYELAEELMDLEEAFHVWRFRHMKTVERIIGMRIGTGGSSGVNYLKGALDKYFFPELWTVRTTL